MFETCLAYTAQFAFHITIRKTTGSTSEDAHNLQTSQSRSGQACSRYGQRGGVRTGEGGAFHDPHGQERLEGRSVSYFLCRAPSSYIHTETTQRSEVLHGRESLVVRVYVCR